MEVPSIFLNRILEEVAKMGASSLHLSVGSAPIARINGKISIIGEYKMLTVDVINRIISSFMDTEEFDELNKKKEIIVVKTFAGNFRFRINIFYQKDLPSISFNFISNSIRDLQELNFPNQIIEKSILKSGLLIIAGPNDSGKTSTIASFLEDINKKKSKYIITLENPIEYLFINKKSIIEQRQIGRDVKSYVDGLKHCLNEDVDLVYIDEIKEDFEDAMPLIFQLADGNSFVVIEINAENSMRVIEKILDLAKKKMSEESACYNLADILSGIIIQKLIPARGGGMVMAKEILVVNSSVRSLIKSGRINQLENIIQTSKNEGMIGMKKSIEDLVKANKINQEEIKELKIES